MTDKITPDSLPVVFASVANSRLNRATYADSVFFTESDLFNFTKRLGILRLHTQKLGKALAKSYPFLARAAVSEEEEGGGEGGVNEEEK